MPQMPSSTEPQVVCDQSRVQSFFSVHSAVCGLPVPPCIFILIRLLHSCPVRIATRRTGSFPHSISSFFRSIECSGGQQSHGGTNPPLVIIGSLFAFVEAFSWDRQKHCVLFSLYTGRHHGPRVSSQPDSLPFEYQG